MITFRVLLARCREALHPARLRRELNEEFETHLELEVLAQMKRGLQRADAERAARLAFGSVERFKEETLDARGSVAITHLNRNIRFAARRLTRAPSFWLPAALLVAIAASACVVIGAIVYGVLLKPLPYADAGRLVQITHSAPGLDLPSAGISGGLNQLYRESSQTLSATAVYFLSGAVSVTDAAASAEQVPVALTSPELLSVLGVRPLRGRLFAQSDVGQRAVIISDGLWQRRYGGDPAIIGRTIELNRQRSVVVGVLPASLGFPSANVGVWYVFAPDTVSSPIGGMYYTGIARLRPGSSPADAERELRTLVQRLPRRFGALSDSAFSRAQLRPKVESLLGATVAPFRSQLLLLAVAASIVLLAALGNLANLFLIRSLAAYREVAIARALGATSAEIARRVFSESTLVALLACVLAFPMTMVAVQLHLGLEVDAIPRLGDVRFGWGLAAILICSCFTLSNLAGLVAWLRLRSADIAKHLSSGSRINIGGGWRRTQRVLVAGQFAVSLALLSAATLAGTSLMRLLRVDLGIRPDSALIFSLPLPYRAYPTYAAATRLHEALLDSLRALPGVRSANVTTLPPLTASRDEESEPIHLEGSGRASTASIAFVSPEYFQTLGTPLSEGRAFQREDMRPVPAVLISQQLARELQPTGRVTGHYIRVGQSASAPSYEIVGVVDRVWGAEISSGQLRSVFFPVIAPKPGTDSIRTSFVPREGTHVVVHTDGDPRRVIDAVRQIVNRLDPQLPIAGVTTLTDRISSTTARARVLAALLGAATAAVLFMSAVGLQGVVSASVASRTREFGVRMALGAAPGQLLRGVLLEGCAVSLTGVTAGVGLSILVAWSMRTLLFGVSPLDPLVLGATALTALSLGAAGSLGPARRAANVNPTQAIAGD